MLPVLKILFKKIEELVPNFLDRYNGNRKKNIKTQTKESQSSYIVKFISILQRIPHLISETWTTLWNKSPWLILKCNKTSSNWPRRMRFGQKKLLMLESLANGNKNLSSKKFSEMDLHLLNYPENNEKLNTNCKHLITEGVIYSHIYLFLSRMLFLLHIFCSFCLFHWLLRQELIL